MEIEREQRKQPRFSCSGDAQVRMPVGNCCRAEILDLSLEGCLVELEEPKELVLETILELTFTVNQLPFRVRGEVRSTRTPTTIGFQFPQLSERSRRQLQELVDELAE